MLIAALVVLTTGNAFAASSFPDLGVQSNHRTMTLIGFAQQTYYFDLISKGGLQSMALTFALIGGLLILLLPSYQKVTTIAAYLLLVFLVIVAPAASTTSLFFYPVAAAGSGLPAHLDCPLPVSDAVEQEVMCHSGHTDSAGGRSGGNLSVYANTRGIDAFLPQLVAVHFFTAIERTMIDALWGSAENRMTPGDVLGADITKNPYATKVLNENQQNMYIHQVYGAICPNHVDALQVGDMVGGLSDNKLKSMAEDYFTFSDAVVANNIYYNSYQNSIVYPARAMTARIRPVDYAKSLSLSSLTAPDNSDAVARATAIQASVYTGRAELALYNYKMLRFAMRNDPLRFPESNSFGTHIFKELAKRDNEYIDEDGWINSYFLGEPDPYDYDFDVPDFSAQFGTNTTPNNGTQRGTLWRQSRAAAGPVVQAQDFLKDPSEPEKGPLPYDMYVQEMDLYLQALDDPNSPSRPIAAAMRDYPVQLLFPYGVGNNSSDYQYFLKGLPAVAGLHGALNGDRLGPRTYMTNNDVYSTDETLTSVQSCLDLAAMIYSRKILALEQAALLRTGGSFPEDYRFPPTAAELAHFADYANVRTPVADSVTSDVQHFDEMMYDNSRNSLLVMGINPDSPPATLPGQAGTQIGNWFSNIFTLSGDVWSDRMEGIGDFFSEIGNNATGASVGENGLQNMRAAHHEGGSPINGITAAFGHSIVNIGVQIASAIQGFVYGAYMRIMPVIISYGLAITLFMTPFVFLLGIAVPAQAGAVLVAPIVAIAFLKTVAITLLVVDHVFVYLMFWVQHSAIVDKGLYEGILVIAHLTASVSLFSLTGMLLFGMKDSGSFVKHLAGMDKAGQISFNEAMAMAAAPVVAAKSAQALVGTGARGVGNVAEKGQRALGGLASATEKGAQKLGGDSTVAGRMAQSVSGGMDKINSVGSSAFGWVASAPLIGGGMREGYEKSWKGAQGRLAFREQQRAGGISANNDDYGNRLFANARGAQLDKIKEAKKGGEVPGALMAANAKGPAGRRNLDSSVDEFFSHLEKAIRKSTKNSATAARTFTKSTDQLIEEISAGGAARNDFKNVSYDRGQIGANMVKKETAEKYLGSKYTSSQETITFNNNGKNEEWVVLDSRGTAGKDGKSDFTKLKKHLESGTPQD